MRSPKTGSEVEKLGVRGRKIGGQRSKFVNVNVNVNVKVNVKFEDGTGRLAKASVPMGFVKVNESRPYLLSPIY